MLHLQEAIPLQGVIHGVQVPVGLNIQNQMSKYNSTCACKQTPLGQGNIITTTMSCGGAVASWLVYSTPD